MRFGPTFFVLMNLYLCLCNGAPPARPRYTKEENRLIIEELIRISDNNSPDKWKQLTKTFQEKWISGTPGFNKMRTSSSLQNHFKEVVSKDLSDNVRKKLNIEQEKAHTFTVRYTFKIVIYGAFILNLIKNQFLVSKEKLLSIGVKSSVATSFYQKQQILGYHRLSRPYSEAENDLIFEELLKSSIEEIYSTKTMEAIRTRHDEKRLAGIPGFENKRSINGLRVHIIYMAQNGQLSEELKEKFPKFDKGASSSTSGSENPQAGLQDTDLGDLKNDEIEEMIQELLHNTDEDFYFANLDD